MHWINQHQLKVLSSSNYSSSYIIIIIAASTPSISYEEINATAIRITWNITGDVNGFIIQIDGIGVNEQLTDNTAREFVVNGLSPEIM